jgi:hypothetical protein
METDMADVLIELSADEMHDLDRDAKIYKISVKPYPLPINHFLANQAPPRHRCEVPDDFLDKFPRWKANVVTGPA